jgi:hypothetical protein
MLQFLNENYNDQYISENNTALGIAIPFNIIISKFATQPIFTFLLVFL